MRYIADLHIHSMFSRATSKASRLPQLAAWAAVKGISVVGTGDFTHPGWLRHISDYLEEAEPGLFRLSRWDAGEIAACLPAGLAPDDLRLDQVRFMLSAEISSIYKKNGKVRKIHSILYAPSLDSVRAINNRLASVGNLESDGRPILGLDARNLLEIVLEYGQGAFMVPAHIWTPWFSLFGSKSGFDSLDECFGDLSQEIFALETGLSSDPDMNRRISALDRFTLISNSDCHSPAKLGREANVFSTELSFSAIREAMRRPADEQGRQRFVATIEFYPEEGKYHCDGHRKCGICYEPEQTRQHDGICPVCGRPLTVGVLHRVLELADRRQPKYPENSPAVFSLIPLPEILSELLSVGAASKKVMKSYGALIRRFSSEFSLLLDVPINDIRDGASGFLAEAIDRVRRGKVIRKPGYDGEFGVIRVFSDEERSRFQGQGALFATAGSVPKKNRNSSGSFPALSARNDPKKPLTKRGSAPGSILNQLDAEQQKIVFSQARHLLVQAGPGSGKTHTLVARVLHCQRQQRRRASLITFTNQAADELRDRLEREGLSGETVFVGTLHRYCLHFLRRYFRHLRVAGPETRRFLLRRLQPDAGARELSRLERRLEWFLQRDYPESGIPVDDFPLYQDYLGLLDDQNLVDLDGIVTMFLRLLFSDTISDRARSDALPERESAQPGGNTATTVSGHTRQTRPRIGGFADMVFRETGDLYVDEFQDLNQAQYRLIHCLARTSRVFAIGDPDQAIYGFRGADPQWFFRFRDELHPEFHRLRTNYRSDSRIVRAAAAIIESMHPEEENSIDTAAADSSQHGEILINPCSSAAEEARFVVSEIEQRIGGTSHREIEQLEHGPLQQTGLGDIAVLYRTLRQGDIIARHLFRQGIPFQMVDLQPFYLQDPLKIITCWFLICGGHATVPHFLHILGQEPGIGAKTLLEAEEFLLGLRSEHFSHLAHAASANQRLRRAAAKLGTFREQIIELARHKGVAAAIRFVADQYTLDPQDASLDRFVDLATTIGTDLGRFAEYLLLNSRSVVYDENAEAVTLMTLHAAKGTQFSTVFLIGLTDQLLPLAPRADLDATQYQAHVAEERRLFFVGVSRARHTLYLSWPESRETKRSRFVNELPADLLQPLDAGRRVRKPVQRRKNQLKLFPDL